LRKNEALRQRVEEDLAAIKKDRSLVRSFFMAPSVSYASYQIVVDLKIGDEVSFPPAELTDWMYMEDGKIIGGYTIRVLRKRMSAKEGADFDANLQFKP